MGCFSRASRFSRSAPASGQAPCASCCRADRAGDDELSRASAARIAALSGRRGPVNAALPPGAASDAPGARVDADCAQRARSLAPVVQRFDRYREALPSARAAADMNRLGDKPGNAPTHQPCLTRLPVQGDALTAALGLAPGTLADADLRNDQTGFRAALYRDETTGGTILVPRDTEPDSLVDWQANTRNGLGLDTPQYRAMRQLTAKLAANDQRFDIAGYSKGGGLAQEGGLVSALSQVRLFNSAGIPDAALARTGRADFDDLVARTRLYSADGDFMTFMNATTDPGQDILNARFLRTELAGEGNALAPIALKTTSPATRGRPDPGFAAGRAAYLKELDEHIDAMQSSYETGGAVSGFPPVRAASKETIAGSATRLGDLLGAGGDRPDLGKLEQHRMGVVLGALENDVKTDRQSLQDFLEACG